MSERDLQRVEVLAEVVHGRRTIASTGAVLALSVRQVHRQLDLAESRMIFRRRDLGAPVTAIARQLGRGRNSFHDPREYAGYFPLTAHDQAPAAVGPAARRRFRPHRSCRRAPR